MNYEQNVEGMPHLPQKPHTKPHTLKNFTSHPRKFRESHPSLSRLALSFPLSYPSSLHSNVSNVFLSEREKAPSPSFMSKNVFPVAVFSLPCLWENIRVGRKNWEEGKKIRGGREEGNLRKERKGKIEQKKKIWGERKIDIKFSKTPHMIMNFDIFHRDHIIIVPTYTMYE